jgi:glycosyltransferase 2 family protein
MAEPTRHSRLSLFINAILVALAFGLLGMVIWQNREKIRTVFSRPLDLRLLAMALAIYLTGMVGTFVRWFLLVRVIEPKFKLSATMVLGSVGMVFNLVIPGAVGGDLIKAAYLVRMHIKRTQAIASMVIDRILGLLALFILAAIAGAFAWPMASSDVRKLIMFDWFAVVTGLAVLAAIFGQVLTRLFPSIGASHSRLGLIVSELGVMSATYRGRLGVVFTCLIMSVFFHALNVIAFYLMGLMLFPEMTTTLAQHFLMVPLTLFSMAVPIPFGALGVSEKVSGQLFELVKHPSGELAMMGFRVLMYAGGLVGACVYLAKLKEIRSLAASAQRLENELVADDLSLAKLDRD